MSTAELNTIKIDLINQIANLKDIAVIERVKRLLDFEKEGTYQLTAEQKKRIALGREQLKNNQTIAHEDLQNEINEWLGTK